MKHLKKLLLSVAVLTIAIVGFGTASNTLAAAKPKITTPVITVEGTPGQVSADIRVTAPFPGTGLPAGFSLQWMKAAEYAAEIPATFDSEGNQLTPYKPANSWYASDDPRLCKASFSGNANNSRYNLLAGQFAIVNLGDNLFDDPGASSNCASTPLMCDTEYVVRAFGHATSTYNRSDFTANLTFRTAPCGGGDSGCTYTQGYWKTHGPIPTGNNSNEWAVTSLFLGNVSYTDLQLQAIFDTPASGNGLISLSHQLIAAKLNVAAGADDSAVAGAIVSADALIGNLVVPPVGAGSLPNSATSALTGILDSYNQGLIGPGHCQ
jgi:hypothetical protein